MPERLDRTAMACTSNAWALIIEKSSRSSNIKLRKAFRNPCGEHPAESVDWPVASSVSRSDGLSL